MVGVPGISLGGCGELPEVAAPVVMPLGGEVDFMPDEPPVEDAIVATGSFTNLILS